MPLRDEDLVEFANCQTLLELVDGATPVPVLATNQDGVPAVVPVGEDWLIHSIELVNTTAGALTPSVWFAPAGVTVSSTTTKWLVVPATSVAANAVLIREPGSNLGRVIRRLHQGGRIIVMGGSDDILLVVLGWRVKR